MVTRTFSIPTCWVLPVAAILVGDWVVLPEPVAVAANASAATATRAITVAKYLRDIVPPFVGLRPGLPDRKYEKPVLQMPRGLALLDEGP
jgi:hypothetical protein